MGLLVADHRGLGSEEIRTLLRAAAKPGPKTDYQRRVGTLSPLRLLQLPLAFTKPAGGQAPTA